MEQMYQTRRKGMEQSTLKPVPKPEPLVKRLEALGLNPISLEELTQYKEEQIQAHPPSWFWRFRDVVPGIAVLCMCVGAFAVTGGIMLVLAYHSLWPLPLSILGAVMGSLPFWLEGIKLRGVAYWRELYCDPSLRGWSELPPAIRQVAEIVNQAEGNRASYYIGTLYQEKTALDPYLTVSVKGEVVCLGIWNGDKIIACA